MQNENISSSIPFYKRGLTNNQLKIIAMLAMVCDHVGKILLPEIMIFQIIGRLSFPIFAYMIAEGCKHTKNRRKYLLQIFGFGAIFQIVYTIFEPSLYQNIFITFTLSIMVIFATERFLNKKNLANFAIMLGAVLVALFFGCLLYEVPSLKLMLYNLTGLSDYYVDYKYLGVMLPILIYFAPSKPLKLIVTTVIVFCYGYFFNSLQYYMFLTIPLLALYNGKRGRAKLKYMFYLFYPAHMVIIYGIAMLINW